MPWAQRLGTTVFKLNAKQAAPAESIRQTFLVPAHERARRVERREFCQACGWHSSSCRNSAGAEAKPAADCSATLMPTPLSTATSTAMADQISPDSLSDGNALSGTAAYRVVNFYHLVQIPNPHQVCIPLCLLELRMYAANCCMSGKLWLTRLPCLPLHVQHSHTCKGMPCFCCVQQESIARL